MSVLLITGGLYFWLGGEDEESPQPVKRVDRHEASKPFYTLRPQPNSLQAFPQEQVPQSKRGGRYADPAGSWGREPYGAMPPADSARRLYSQTGGYSFRQLEQKANREPENPPAFSYPQDPTNQGFTGMPFVPGIQGSGRFSEPQPPAGAQYRFRPREVENRPKRWIGNYQPMPRTMPQAPMQPRNTPAPGQYASPWRQSVPSEGYNPMWADTRGVP